MLFLIAAINITRYSGSHIFGIGVTLNERAKRLALQLVTPSVRISHNLSKMVYMIYTYINT